MDYIASRPRVQKLGAHGLFTSSDGPLVLSQVADEVAHHPGVVWLPIISLRREDAARLGYDNAQNWKELITRSAPEIAKAMDIPLDQFRWYAAFHDESHHPHLHMVCYSADAKSGFLTRRGIADIKSMLAKEIFQQDLYAIYQRQTKRRDELTEDARKAMVQLVTEMQTGTLENQRIQQLMVELAQRLQECSGKKQYGYLPPAVKSLVDEIVTELEKDPHIAAAYDLWYQEREEVLRTYKDDLPPREPLIRQKAFKRIKNIVIEEAVRLGDMPPPDLTDQVESVEELTDDGSVVEPFNDAAVDAPTGTGEVSPHARWTRSYRTARQFLYGDEDSPPDFAAALDLLTQEADAGNALAMADLGRMYAEGLGGERDPELAQEWYDKALAAFLSAEKATPDRSPSTASAGCSSTEWARNRMRWRRCPGSKRLPNAAMCWQSINWASTCFSAPRQCPRMWIGRWNCSRSARRMEISLPSIHWARHTCWVGTSPRIRDRLSAGWGCPPSRAISTPNII